MKLIKGLKNMKTFELSNEECLNLIQSAKSAMINTYPDSNKGYATAVMTLNGNIYEGASYNSDTQTLTMHGEMVALTHANLHGEKDIVAIVGPNCHICKQLIYESSIRSHIDTVIIIQEEDLIKQIPISKLMPYPWPEIH